MSDNSRGTLLYICLFRTYNTKVAYMNNVITLTTFGHLVLVLSVHFIVEVSQRKFSGLRFLMILAKSIKYKDLNVDCLPFYVRQNIEQKHYHDPPL